MKFIIEELNGYQIMPTEYLRNRNLSLKAKGLLSMMYSLPNDWDYSMNGLKVITNTGITSLRATIAELELNGYIWREEKRNDKKQFEYIYHVYHKPKKRSPFDCVGLRRFKTAINKMSEKEKERKISRI